MAWGLGVSDLPDKQEVGRVKREGGESIEWKISEDSAVFKEIMMEEHWVPSFSTFIWP